MAKLEVHVVSPEREIWTGEADMVVAKGTDGDVGIMPGHAPMLISLANHPIRIIGGDQPGEISVEGGFLHVSSSADTTRVDVLAERATVAGGAP